MPQLGRAELNSLGVNPGQLRHRVTILEAVKTTGKSGVVTTYAPASTPVKAWARITPLKADEILRLGLDITRYHVEMVMRYNVYIDTTKRIQTSDGTQYIITSLVNTLNMNAYLELLCESYGNPSITPVSGHSHITGFAPVVT